MLQKKKKTPIAYCFILDKKATNAIKYFLMNKTLSLTINQKTYLKDPLQLHTVTV